MYGETVGTTVPRAPRRIIAVAALCLVGCGASWTYRVVTGWQQTKNMPESAAIEALRSEGLSQEQRDLALRVLKNRAIELVEIIKRDQGAFADVALLNIMEASKR